MGVLLHAPPRLSECVPRRVAIDDDDVGATRGVDDDLEDAVHSDRRRCRGRRNGDDDEVNPERKLRKKRFWDDIRMEDDGFTRWSSEIIKGSCSIKKTVF